MLWPTVVSIITWSMPVPSLMASIISCNLHGSLSPGKNHGVWRLNQRTTVTTGISSLFAFCAGSYLIPLQAMWIPFGCVHSTHMASRALRTKGEGQSQAIYGTCSKAIETAETRKSKQDIEKETLRSSTRPSSLVKKTLEGLTTCRVLPSMESPCSEHSMVSVSLLWLSQ